MKRINQISKLFLIGLLGLSSAVALGACSPSPDTAEQPVEESPADTTETPTDTTQPEETTTEDGENIVALASTNESFSTLVEAIEAAGLTETLSEGSYTVFAPTNEAFEQLPEGTLEELLEPENQEQLAMILQYHVVPEEITSDQITAGEVDTLEGSPVTIEVNEETGEFDVNEARITETDVQASNGVIHAIDTVLMPPDAEASPSPDAEETP